MAAKTAIVVLAAGEGIRMVSALPKVLHRIGGNHDGPHTEPGKPARVAQDRRLRSMRTAPPTGFRGPQ